MVNEIALCILSTINLGKMSSKEMMEEYCDLAVRLEELIDHQNYPVDVTKRSTVARRSLGILYWSSTFQQRMVTNIMI